MNDRKFLLVALLVGFTACGGGTGGQDESAEGAAATSNNDAEEGLADLTTYELTMAGMDKYFQTLRNLTEAMKAMTPAEREAAAMKSSADASLEDMIRNAEANEVYSAAARKAGLSPRESVLISMAYITSAMAAGVMQMQPTADQDSLARAMNVNPANIRFVRETEAELTKKYQDVAAEMNALEGDPE